MTTPAYLLPENITPDDDFCAKVYIPNEDLYRRAFLGSYMYLSTWLAWERDGTDRAARAAERWKDSVDKTMDRWGAGCDGDCPECEDCELCDMTKDELIEIIEEIMTITINNNVGCGCGCGCSCDGSTIGGDMFEPPDDPLPPVDDWDGTTIPPGVFQSDAQRCSFSNYLVYTLRLALLRAVTHDGNQTSFNEYLDSLYDFLGTGGGELMQVAFSLAFEVYVWVLARLNGNTNASAQITDMFDEHYNYYVCALYSSSSEVGAYQALRDALEETIPDLIVRSVAQNIAEVLPYQLLTADAGSIAIPAGFDNRECCGNTPEPLPEPIDGYDAYFDSVSITSGQTWSGEMLDNQHKVIYGVPYLVESTYHDVAGQSVDGQKMSWRVNDGVGGRVDISFKVTNISNWWPRPNGYVDSLKVIAADDSITIQQADDIPIPEDTLFTPAWYAWLMGASEDADANEQYGTWTCQITFYPIA